MTMVNLAVPGKANTFVNCYTMLLDWNAATNNGLREFELDFVESMKEKFESREAALDLGVTPWNPTTKQYLYLTTLKGQYCG